MIKQLLLIIIISFLASSCDKVLLGKEDNMVSLEENLNPPLKTDDGLEVSTLAIENINAAPIQNIVRDLQQTPRNIHSFLIMKNGKLVLEAYFDGWHKERLQSMRSATKSINSALVGIAIDKGYIQNIEQKLFDFYPQYASLKNAQNDKINLQHLLTMTSGFQWDQSTYPNEDSGNDEGVMERSKDPLYYVLQKPVTNAPGKIFLYNSGNSNLLAGIVYSASGKRADVFAKEFLFDPLGIKNFEWPTLNGFVNAGAGLYLRPRDMLKIGKLYLDKGQWNGKQIISSAWIDTSSKAYSGDETRHSGYGFQWWVSRWSIKNKTIKSFQANGNGGQNIFVFPSLQTVIVFTGGNYAPLDQNLPYKLLQNVILDAIQ